MFEVKVGKNVMIKVLDLCSKKQNEFEFVDINDFNEEDFSSITLKLTQSSDLFIKVMNGLENENLNEEVIESIYQFLRCTISNRVSSKENYIKLKGKFLNNDNLSSKDLGMIAWDYVSNGTGEYINVEGEFEDEDYIQLWNNIDESLKGEVKLSILQPDRDVDYDLSVKIWHSIIESADNLVSKSLKYFYVKEGTWYKLETLGILVWNNIIKFDSRFTSIAKDVEDKNGFEEMLEKFAENIPECAVKCVGKTYIYDELLYCENKGKMPWVHIPKANPDMYEEILNTFMKVFDEEMSKYFTLCDDIYLNKTTLENKEKYSSMEVKFDTEIEVTAVIDFNGYTYCKVSTCLPYLDNCNKIQIAHDITFKYSKTLNKYVLCDNKVKKFFGIDEEELISKVNSLVVIFVNKANDVSY